MISIIAKEWTKKDVKNELEKCAIIGARLPKLGLPSQSMPYPTLDQSYA